MATASAPKGSLKETFAKVAAMSDRQLSQPEVSESSISSLETTDQTSTTNTSLSSNPHDGQFAMQIKRADADPVVEDQSHVEKLETISSKVDALQIRDEGSEVVAKKSDLDHDPQAAQRGGREFAMDRLPTSVSELSTKPSSLDGKSTASGMIDEKESLRPDDSASAKATEEEDYYSTTGPGLASFRCGSEQGTRAFRAQFSEISERIGYTSQPQVSSSHYISVTQPQLGPPGTVPVVNDSMPTLHGADVSEPPLPFGFNKLEPDEKLLEALENPKDRLFVLRLEQDVIDFVKDSKEPTLELPPCNSFCRLLIHKLADYYFLTHFVDTKINAVRLFRTPFCRLPPPLTGISNPPTSRSTPPPGGPTMKIMRRDNMGKNNIDQTFHGNSNDNSVKASRTASITDGEMEGDNGESSTKEKGNMTREQREAKYKEARERIFKGFVEETDVDERKTATDTSKQTSRSSSSSGKNRVAGKGGRNPVDDEFQARSQFTTFYPPSQPPPPFQVISGPIPYGPYPIQPAFPGQFTTTATYPGGEFQPYNRAYVHPLPSQPMATSCNQFYFDGTVAEVNNQPFPSTAQRFGGPSQMSHPIYPSSDHDNMSFPPGSYPPNFRRPLYSQAHQPNWPQPPPLQSQPHTPRSTYSTHAVDNATEPTTFPNGMPVGYPYGRSPNQPYYQNGQQRVNYHHPVPGSFNRHSFNPRTQPFIPGGGKAPDGYYGPPLLAHTVGFQPTVNHPAHMPPNFSAPTHGLNQSRSPPRSRSAQFSQINSNSRIPSAPPQGFANTTPIPHNNDNNKSNQHPQQQQSTLPTRWNQQHNLPPKPPVVTPPLMMPPHRLSPTNQG
ncbi:MAG: hypothetical protein M1816_002902 [Peltula sp. TS41687]|nr:MAG: hypothetical protein M1816_002902 [Peltula sp. TS41687]